MHSVRHFRSGGRANARKVQKRTMDKKGKQQFLLVAFGVALYAAAALLSLCVGSVSLSLGEVTAALLGRGQGQEKGEPGA